MFSNNCFHKLLTKNDAQGESCGLSFIWDKSSTWCSLGDCSSDISEKLLHRGSGEMSIYVILVKAECVQSSTYFSRRFLLVC